VGLASPGGLTQADTPSTYLNGRGMVFPMRMSLITARRLAPSSAESVP
jgi:hypothetical protein